MSDSPRPWHVSALRKLVGGPRVGTRLLFRSLPSGRRCKVCWVPMQGLFSVPFQAIRIGPSRKNPSMCTM